jgi:hypothetical protein
MAGSSADILVKRGVRLVTIPFRHEMGAFQERRTCAWKPTGRSSRQIVADGRWRQLDVALRQRASTALAACIRIPRASGSRVDSRERDSRLRDRRTLGPSDRRHRRPLSRQGTRRTIRTGGPHRCGVGAI